MPASRPQEPAKVIAPRIDEQEYSVDHVGSIFLIRTNDKGRTFRLVSAPVAKPGRASWKELIPNRPATMLEDADAFSDHMVTTEREDGLVHFRVRNARWQPAEGHELPGADLLGVPGAELRVRDDASSGSPIRRSITPMSVYDYNVKTGERTLLKRQPVLGGYDPDNYKSERIWATAGDGTKVPISLVYRKELVRNGQRPMLLEGYGSYGYANDVVFLLQRT